MRFLASITDLPPSFHYSSIRKPVRGPEQLVGSVWARCPQHCGFDPPLGKFSGIGGFSLGVNMGSNSIPPKTLSDESINRGLVCAHFIARTQKILTFMSMMGECRQQKHTKHAPSTKMECDYLNGWIKKPVMYAKISPKSGEPHRYSWGTQKKKNPNKQTKKTPKNLYASVTFLQWDWEHS